jgi:hemerythrin-like domain-containing protein
VPPAQAEAGPSGGAPMDIFDMLTGEHRLISRTLDAFERFIAKVEGGQPLDPVEFNRFVVFLREFVELIHNDKEENVIFPAMQRLGYSKAGAPIAHIHSEHRREEKLLFELRQAAVRGPPLSSARSAQLIGLVHELIAFERSHIKKEDELFYPTVKKELGGQTLESITRQLWTADDADLRLVEDSWLRTLAAELARAHGPA